MSAESAQTPARKFRTSGLQRGLAKYPKIRNSTKPAQLAKKADSAMRARGIPESKFDTYRSDVEGFLKNPTYSEARKTGKPGAHEVWLDAQMSDVKFQATGERDAGFKAQTPRGRIRMEPDTPVRRPSRPESPQDDIEVINLTPEIPRDASAANEAHMLNKIEDHASRMADLHNITLPHERQESIGQYRQTPLEAVRMSFQSPRTSPRREVAFTPATMTAVQDATEEKEQRPEQAPPKKFGGKEYFRRFVKSRRKKAERGRGAVQTARALELGNRYRQMHPELDIEQGALSRSQATQHVVNALGVFRSQLPSTMPPNISNKPGGNMSMSFGSTMWKERRIIVPGGEIYASGKKVTISVRKKSSGTVSEVTAFLQTDFPYGGKIAGQPYSLVSLIPAVLKRIPGSVVITS